MGRRITTKVTGRRRYDNGIVQREGFTPKWIAVSGGGYMRYCKRDFLLLIEKLENEKASYIINEVYL